MTVGLLPAERGGMLTETYPARQRAAGPVLWAMTSGIAGVVANAPKRYCFSAHDSPGQVFFGRSCFSPAAISSSYASENS